MVYPDRQQTAVPDGARCQEVMDMIGDNYLRCNSPATCVVDHQREGEPAYYMCMPCGNHNVRNRGARLVCGDAGIR